MNVVGMFFKKHHKHAVTPKTRVAQIRSQLDQLYEELGQIQNACPHSSVEITRYDGWDMHECNICGYGWVEDHDATPKFDENPS